MALFAAALTAGTVATASYLNAKHHIYHDLVVNGTSKGKFDEGIAYITAQAQADRLLNYHVIEDQALKHRPNQSFIWFEGREWTYRQFYDGLQRVGNWLINDLGIQKDEIVAIDGGNSPEYLLLWYALDAIGAVPSFINCNLTSKALVHCVQLCKSRYLIADSDIQSLVDPIMPDLQSAGTKVLYYNAEFFASLQNVTPLPVSRSQGIKPDDLRSLIYTSGTTGLPKATMLRTGRELNTGRAIAKYLKLKPADRMYTCMPLYHGAAHGLCITPVIHAGASVALGRKFSHRTFWTEARDSKANSLQYVGELCRYLINAPSSENEKNHNVSMAWGNGMRPDVWELFRQRFGIETINELYAATDGLGATFNRNRGDFGRNSIGIRGWFWHWENSDKEVRCKIDPVTENLQRGPDGFAIRVGINEPGEVLHFMADELEANSAFAGYYDDTGASDKRFSRDVFKKGDHYFRSGDVQRVDEDGRTYFVDRLGDTFRWKSENVSTNEVSDVMGRNAQIAEANVYGVQIPNADGRCGCAAIVFANGITESSADFHDLAQHAIANLPRYAVPIFLRVTPQLSYTGTMKLQKGTLRKEGVDLDNLKGPDRLYWLPQDAKAYIPFQTEDWSKLKAGQARL